MNNLWYKHEKRHPKNVSGPFYSLAEFLPENRIRSACLDCNLPQAEARDLISSLDGDDGDTYFIKQPDTADEIENAITATQVCCVDAIRYGGNDKSILERMDPADCDYEITLSGVVKLKKEKLITNIVNYN